MWDKELSFDATHVLADAAMDSLTARFAVEARAVVQAQLATLFPDETTRQRPKLRATPMSSLPPRRGVILPVPVDP